MPIGLLILLIVIFVLGSLAVGIAIKNQVNK